MIKSEEKYRNIFENIQDMVFQTDSNGLFLNISPSTKDVTGYTPEELIGKPTNVLQTDEEKPDDVIKLIQEKFILKNFEKLVKTKSGEIICISLNAQIIFYKIKDVLDGFCGIIISLIVISYGKSQ